ncbi:MAG: YbaK/EbsC family protein [Thermomicrobiales bacterium]
MSELTTTAAQQQARTRVLDALDRAGATYHLFAHRPVMNYEDAELARQESGFTGTESKSMVLRSGDAFVVYVTLAGKRVDFKAMRAHIGGPKPKLVSDDELREHFGAEPGNAYPLGFDAAIPIYVDPEVFVQEWLLFSPAVPTETVQLRGADLRAVYTLLGNPLDEVAFTQG